MDEYVRNMAVSGGLLGLLVLLRPLASRAPVGLTIAGLALGLGLGLGMVPTGALESALPRSVVLVAGWLLLSELGARTSPRLPGSFGVWALGAGLVVGDLAAAALVASAMAPGKQAGRAALTASAGAMLSGFGTPAVLLLGPIHPVLALLLAAVAWPRGEAPSGGLWLATALLVTLAIVGRFAPGLGLALALVVVGLVAIRRPRTTPVLTGASLAWLLAAAAAVMVARSSGLLHQLVAGLDIGAGQLGELAPLAAAATGAVFSALGGEPAAAMAFAEMADVQAIPHVPELRGWLSLGVAVGGIGPALLVARGRELLVPWTLQLLVVAAWALGLGWRM